ncbi:GHKL domain-containing protein [Vibrio sp. V31_P5A7T61]|uniref:ATP-binding protein n=2 Tax=Vibrio TaxID=662 RepID=UPI001372E7E4|nr:MULTISPECIES: sensor histidine kinase [unclassified Vibrio]NAW61475.1 GHKL domain-containing protein [Vibrio sp. V31_P5A7T61]NAX64946.1 GHKL domain-containing protein [Vibrio sp. V32_P6A28T40]
MKLKSYLALTTIATTSSIVIVVTCAIFFLLQNSYTEGLKARGLELARVIANDPAVIEAVNAQNTSPTRSSIADYMEHIRAQTDASYIVVVDKKTMRLSHPDPTRVGQRFIGEDIYPALIQGAEYSSIHSGTLGKAIRNFSPIYWQDEVIGAVSIGYLSEKTSDILLAQYGHLGGLIAVVYLLGIGISSAFVFKMKRTFLDYEPEFIIHKFREHEMVLDSIRDAIIAVDNNMNITTINNSAMQKLSMGVCNRYDYLNQPLSRYSTPLSHLVLAKPSQLHQGEFSIGQLNYKVDIYPIASAKGVKGQVIVFFPNLEQNELEREVVYLKNYAQLLRSKTHEYSNKLNVLSGLLQSQKHHEAIEFIQQETDRYQSIIHNIVFSVNDSVIAGLLLAKFNKASEIGVKFIIDEDTHLSSYPKNLSEKFVTILGNLIDNALLAAWQNRASCCPLVHIYLSDRSHHIIFEVQDSGAGVSEQITEHILEFGVSTKLDHEQSGVGLYLVKQWVDNFNGSIDWERTDENTTLFSIYLDKNKVINYE